MAPSLLFVSEQVEPWHYFDYRMTTRALVDLYCNYIEKAPVPSTAVVDALYDARSRTLAPLPAAFIGSPRPQGAIKAAISAGRAHQHAAQAVALRSHGSDGVSVTPDSNASKVCTSHLPLPTTLIYFVALN